MARRQRSGSPFKGKVSANVKQQQRSGFGYLNLEGSDKTFKEEPNSRVHLDIMPYEVTDPNHLDRDDKNGIATPGSIWYRKPFKIHRNVGATNDVVVCPSSVNKPCPICEYRQQQLDAGAKWTDDDIKKLRAKDRNLYAVIPIGEKEYDEVPHIWDISQFLFQEKLNEELEEFREFEIFPDLEEGYTLRIRFSEESFGSNTYAETSRIDFEERDYVYGDSDLDAVPNLDEKLRILEYEKIHSMFFDLEMPDEEDAEPVNKTVSRSRKRKTVKPEEEEEDSPAPKRKRKKKSTRKPESRAERRAEIREDEEEEEEEKSQPKRRRTTKPDPEKEVQERIEEGEDRCPYGHRFGIDAEEFDDCDYCEIWADCIEEKESGSQ